ncbi:MAG: hypothetical protein ACI3V3_00435 [Faecousia sp.]
MWNLFCGKRRLTSVQIIMLGFLGAIPVGALLLSLPFATSGGHRHDLRHGVS